jgi:exonuclease VII large subunit
MQELLDLDRTLARGFVLVRTAAGLWSGKPPLQSGDKIYLQHREGTQEIEVK